MGKREEKCMKTNTDLFEKVPVPKAVATMAVPTMISMLVVVIYNMADTFFISTLSPYTTESSRPIQSNFPKYCMAFSSLKAIQSGLVKASFILPDNIWYGKKRQKELSASTMTC